MAEIYAIETLVEVNDQDFPAIGEVEQKRILIAIAIKLSSEPDHFGKPLRKPLAGYWDLRVGSYRVIYRIIRQMVTIVIVIHRSFGYGPRLQRIIAKRINSRHN